MPASRSAGRLVSCFWVLSWSLDISASAEVPVRMGEDDKEASDCSRLPWQVMSDMAAAAHACAAAMVPFADAGAESALAAASAAISAVVLRVVAARARSACANVGSTWPRKASASLIVDSAVRRQLCQCASTELQAALSAGDAFASNSSLHRQKAAAINEKRSCICVRSPP